MALALGLGVNTAIFTAVKALLLDPLPYRDPSRVVRLELLADGEPFGLQGRLSPPEVRDWQRLASSLEVTAELHIMRFNAILCERPYGLWTGVVSAPYFEVLGVQALHGRTFVASDDVPGATPVAVLSHGLWQRAYGGDPKAVGEAFSMNGTIHRVVGVLPPIPDFPAAAEIFITTVSSPYRSRPLFERRTSRVVTGLGRLTPGVSPATAEAELDTVVETLQQQYPEALRRAGDTKLTARVTPVAELINAEATTTLGLLQLLAGLVLATAVVNVTCLVLASVNRRSHELMVRQAVGAPRSRLARALVLETTGLALAGGALGAGLAWVVLPVIGALTGNLSPRSESAVLDAGVLGGTMLVAAACGVAVALLPNRRIGRLDLHHLGAGARVVGRKRHLLIALVVAQLALSTVLVNAAALAGRSLVNLFHVDLGCDPNNVVAARLSLDWSRFILPGEGLPERNTEGMYALYDAVLERVRGLPGVEAAGLVAEELPMSPRGYWGQVLRGVSVGGDAPTTAMVQAATVSIWPGYLQALRVPVLAGRLLGRDDAGAPTVIVSRSLATALFQTEPAIGQTVQLMGRPQRVVGVVEDVHMGGLADRSPPQVYRVFLGMESYLVVRTTDDPDTMLRTLVTAIHNVEPELPVDDVRLLRDVWRQSIAPVGWVAVLIGLFAAAALAIAGAGLAGLTASMVTRRWAEIGVRQALGAVPTQVARLVVGRALALVGAGVLIGSVGAIFVGRATASWLYGVPPHDPASLLISAASLVAVGAIATVSQVRRATRVDPSELLRRT